jgi:hypothetical protein
MEQYKKNKERHHSMYTDNYQPAYDDLEKLEEACHELAATTSVTSYEHLMSIREQLKKLAIGETDTPLIMAAGGKMEQYKPKSTTTPTATTP